MATLSMICMLLTGGLFVVDASTQATYEVKLSREALRRYVDDVGLFERNMPGVVSVKSLGDVRYLYSTAKEIPFAGMMRTDFVIEKRIVGDSVTWYRSTSIQDPNYMSCKVILRPRDEGSTTIEINLRIRLSRENASDVHWLAPVLGEQFISEKMTDDLDEMLKVFIRKSNEELYGRSAAEITEN